MPDLKPVYDPADAPRRRLHLTLDLRADDLDALWHTVRNVVDELHREGRTKANMISGGHDSGFSLTLTDQGEHVTGESYREALTAYLDSVRPPGPAPVSVPEGHRPWG